MQTETDQQDFDQIIDKAPYVHHHNVDLFSVLLNSANFESWDAHRLVQSLLLL